MKNRLFFMLFLMMIISGKASNGYDLWLNYSKIENEALLQSYRSQINHIYFKGQSETLNIAKEELKKGLDGLLGQPHLVDENYKSSPSLMVAKFDSFSDNEIKALIPEIDKISKEGFVIKSVRYEGVDHVIISAKSDIGILYGVFNFLRLIKTNQNISNLSIIDSPKIDIRILNHWDNLDRTVERGYAGESIWNWHKLPGFIDQRYIDYARANASIGINGTVLTNVNSNALILTPQYLEKVEALAKVFRPYGIKVYLTARFSAPMELGNLETADPLDPRVIEWWQRKAEEIYNRIPDFGGFLVKANSEGQPGPQNFGRNHVDGAKLLADAVRPFNGIVMWRAFVYSEDDSNDRAKQAYSEFVPYDGKFPDNVIIQVKNGPIDFQPREPFHPMFGAMPNSNLMMEFQITQEYLGFSSHLVFLPKLYEEVLDSNTYTKNMKSPVSSVIDGSVFNNSITGMAGVANIGSSINWTGHPFGQANWYGFGRLSWNPNLNSDDIAEEWIRQTFTNNSAFVVPIKDLMMRSREAVVSYMTPLGLHHLMDTNHHYGPGPWVDDLSRPEWNPVYYHNASKFGIGFNRTATGSNAVGQYHQKIKEMYNDAESCPEELLLWFHHLSWDFKLNNGETLWNALGLKYQEGVDEVKEMIQIWAKMKPFIDDQRFQEVKMLLAIQLQEAIWWKNACMLYFQQFSNQDFPLKMEPPDQSLDYYQSLKFPFAPGIKPQWD